MNILMIIIIVRCHPSLTVWVNSLRANLVTRMQLGDDELCKNTTAQTCCPHISAICANCVVVNVNYGDGGNDMAQKNEF